MATKVDEQTLRINCSEYSGGPIYRNGSVTISNGNQNVIIKICQGTDPTKYPQRD
jgi:hypothetical protein